MREDGPPDHANVGLYAATRTNPEQDGCGRHPDGFVRVRR